MTLALCYEVSCMSKLTNQAYLLGEQYKDASNLNARIALHERFSANPYSYHRWLFDRLDVPPQGRVLEVGCGPATFWTKNLDRIPVKWNITLTDLSSGMVQQAERNLAPGGRIFTYSVADAQALPFPDGSFDAVIANHMLYHVPHIDCALLEVRRVLPPGGRFYTSTNGQDHMRELAELMHRFSPDAPLLGASFANSFTLENGLEQLTRRFSGVALDKYLDRLAITEVAPLVAYVRSSTIGAHFDAQGFTHYIEQELAEHRVIHITKDTGLFVAQSKLS